MNEAFNFIWLLSIGMIFISLPSVQRELFENEHFYDYKSLWLTNYTMMLGVGMFIATSPLSSIAFYVLGNKYLAFCGMVSYSMYLLHRYPLRVFTFISESSDTVKFIVFFFGLLPIVITMAYLGYKYVERPCQRFMMRCIKIKPLPHH